MVNIFLKIFKLITKYKYVQVENLLTDFFLQIMHFSLVRCYNNQVVADT